MKRPMVIALVSSLLLVSNLACPPAGVGKPIVVDPRDAPSGAPDTPRPTPGVVAERPPEGESRDGALRIGRELVQQGQALEGVRYLQRALDQLT